MPRAVIHRMVKGSQNVDIEENEINNDVNVSGPPVAFCLMASSLADLVEQ